MQGQCPVDQTALTRIEVLGRAVQSCSQCGGTFLADGDLTALTRLSPRALKLEPSHTGSMVCPDCGSKLCRASAAGQELQACPQCSGVWLGQGGLRRLMSTGSQNASRVAPRARLWLASLAVVAALALLVPLGYRHLRNQQYQREAEQAWQLRDGAALQRQIALLPAGESRKLTQARAQYLQQNFVECLNLLVGQDSDAALALLKQAESGWMGQVAWPGRVLGSLAVDLDQDTDRELLRLTDPGWGDTRMELEILSRRRRVYQTVAIEFRKPDGTALKKPEKAVALLDFRSERLTDHHDGLLFLKLANGQFALDVVSADEDKILRFRFSSDTPIKVKEAHIHTSQGDYSFQDDHFRKQ